MAGRTASATGRAERDAAALTDTYMGACATSSAERTRWQGVAPSDSLVKSSMKRSVCCVSNACPNGPAVCLTVKPVGEPDALIGHVRFDERGWETERCRMAQATAPILDSTIASVRGGAWFDRSWRLSGPVADIAESKRFTHLGHWAEQRLTPFVRHLSLAARSLYKACSLARTRSGERSSRFQAATA